MEKQTKLLLGLAAVGVAGYLFWKSKKKTASPEILQSPAAPVKAPEENKYPIGMKEGDVVKGTPEDVYLLKAGMKHPVTYEWFMYNVGDFGKVLRIEDGVLNLIPTGETLN